MRWTLPAALLAALGLAPASATGGEGGGEPMMAPELDGARGWVGTEKPLALADLRGKVILLDFWTYG